MEKTNTDSVEPQCIAKIKVKSIGKTIRLELLHRFQYSPSRKDHIEKLSVVKMRTQRWMSKNNSRDKFQNKVI